MDGNFQPKSSVKMSPGGLTIVYSNNMQLEANNDGSPCNHDVSRDMKQSFEALRTNINHPSPKDSGYAEDAVAVYQEDESDGFVMVSQEDEPPSLNDSDGIATTPSKTKPRRRRKSTVDDASKATRRRSIRLQARVLEPLTPEKCPLNEKACGASCEPSNATDELTTLDLEMMEDDNNPCSKPSSRRRSIRIQGKKHSPAVDSAKKSQTKRRSTKKRSREETEVPVNSTNRKDDDVLPPPKRLILEEKEAPVDYTEEKDGIVLSPLKRPSLEEKEAPVDTSSFEIGLSENGHVKLVQSLKTIAFDVVIGSSSFDHVSKRKSTAGRSRKRGRRVKPSMLASLNSTAKEKVMPRNRRDTFDLSKKRGLTGAAKRMGHLNVFIDQELSHEDASPDYVTPKAGSTEVNIDAIVSEISRTLDDEPKEGHQNGTDEVTESAELSAVKNNLQNLTSIAIEDKMRQLFPDKMKLVYKYPCVSARIFAAMSTVYEDQADFAPLLPFLLSLVDAEIVSLKNQEENEPIFINRKVCFSGFDYSSTTTALGAAIGQGGGDLRPSIEALEAILQQALKLPRPIHYLDAAIQCLQCMVSHGDASDACAKTMVGYFPSARFEKALKHYLCEFKDVKCYVLSQQSQANDSHIGVRYRLNDFIGRSVRYHLRELLNTIPESVVDFNVEECEERWGRAVDDRSIGSILNFSLEKIYELMMLQPKIFDYGVQSMPHFFAREASTRVHSLSMTIDDLKQMDKTTYESLVLDITEARSFLFGARACKFVLKLFRCPGVAEHIHAVGGWASVEAIASTFYNLNVHEGSENEHFVQLREVRDLIFMLEDVHGRFEQTVEHCEFSIRRLRRKFNFPTKSSFVHNLKVHLAGEKGEYFPLVVTL